ncbi:MAG: hypothetical protein ABDH34_08705 [Dictyoglomus thermophilum]|uniref:Uncharacterized protein n=1 Tax=Dictyoglomus thermophilum TaxID=14 RepID=A0A7V3ZH37_DICTH
MKNVFLIIFLIISLISPSFSQSLNINGNIYINTYFSIFSGDPYLLSLTTDILKGIYIYQNSQFFLNYNIPKFTLDFSYISHPIDTMELFLNLSEFKIKFSNIIDLTLSPLSLYNKRVNGVYTSYSNNLFSLQSLISKIEGAKKYKKFYGNNTPGPYFLQDTSITPLSERIYLNGNLLQRDLDYTIDYKQGIFLFNFVITTNDLIVIEYESSNISEIYNLSGISIGMSFLNLSYLNIENPSNNTQNNFLEVGINIEKDENNLINIRRSFSFNNWEYLGRADYLKLALSKDFLITSFEYLYADKDYSYKPEILGNNNLVPDSKYTCLNLNLFPFSPLIYSFNLERKNNPETEYSKQTHNIILDTNNLKTKLSYSYENQKEEIEITYTYNPLSLNGIYKKNITTQSINETYSISLSPVAEFLNPYFILQSSTQNYYDKSYLKDLSYTIGINIRTKNFECNIGETFNKKENLSSKESIYLAQIYMTDGLNYSFYFSYTTLDISSVSVYINNIPIQNDGTFTYLFPDGTSKTYTVNLYIYENRVDIFFLDNEGIHPPPPDLSITIYYPIAIPQESYLLSQNLQLKFINPKRSFSISLQRLKKDLNYEHIINLSTQGTIFENAWLDLVNIHKFYEKNNRFSLKFVYSFTPSYLYLDLNINSFPYAKTITSKVNPVLILGENSLNLSFEYFENTYYDIYFRLLSLILEVKKKISQKELKLRLHKTWREYTPSTNLGTYLLNSESIDLSEDLQKGKYEFSLVHEKYNTDLDKYLITINYIPKNFSQKFLYNYFYLKGIYHSLALNHSFILQIGSNISVSF